MTGQTKSYGQNSCYSNSSKNIFIFTAVYWKVWLISLEHSHMRETDLWEQIGPFKVSDIICVGESGGGLACQDKTSTDMANIRRKEIRGILLMKIILCLFILGHENPYCLILTYETNKVMSFEIANTKGFKTWKSTYVINPNECFL